MANYIDYPEVEDNFVKSEKEEYQENKSPFEQNPNQSGEYYCCTDSGLENGYEHISSEDDDNNYYSLRQDTHNDSKLIILLSIGSLISLGILVNSILT